KPDRSGARAAIERKCQGALRNGFIGFRGVSDIEQARFRFARLVLDWQEARRGGVLQRLAPQRNLMLGDHRLVILSGSRGNCRRQSSSRLRALRAEDAAQDEEQHGKSHKSDHNASMGTIEIVSELLEAAQQVVRLALDKGAHEVECTILEGT